MKLSDQDLISITNRFSNTVMQSLMDTIKKHGYGTLIDSLQSGPKLKMIIEIDASIKRGISDLMTTVDYIMEGGGQK